MSALRLFSSLLLTSVALAQSPVTVVDKTHNLTYVGSNHTGVENFQGIRYGQDTSGQNRFKHPQPFAYPQGTHIVATAAGPSCPQSNSQSLFGFTENPGIYGVSEDCLNLRIARPAGTTQNANLPVMVWIYGGGDEAGSTNYSLYDPTALVLGAAQKGTPLVFVAMNYRLNVFGFANSPALAGEESLNSGLLDQRLALQWINSNIAAFGGNSKQVTLWGQSDGATGIGLQMTAYGGKGNVTFQRAIMDSGSAAADPGVSGNTTAISTVNVAHLAGCKQTNSSAQLTCLRSLSTQTLLTAVLKYENQTSTTTNQDIFFPVLDNDFIPTPPSQLLRSGRFHKNISTIAGWNMNDGSIFTPSTLNTSVDVTRFIHSSYPHLTTSTITQLLSLYPLTSFTSSATVLNISPYVLQAAQIYRDINFACPALLTTQAIQQYNSPNSSNYPINTTARSWLYSLNATALSTLLQITNSSYDGVIHISDVPFVFNDAQDIGLGITNANNVTQTRMSGSWARFVATGDVSGMDSATSITGWEEADIHIMGNGTSATTNTTTNGTVTSAKIWVIGGPTPGLVQLELGNGTNNASVNETGGMGKEALLVQVCVYQSGVVL